MSEEEAIEIILDNKKEYERIIKELDDVRDANDNKPIETIKDCQKFVQAIETILDLYQQEKEKNKFINEIKTIGTDDTIQVVLTKSQYSFLLNKSFNSVSKDKIRAKIKELENQLKKIYDDEDKEGRIDISNLFTLKTRLRAYKELLKEE